MSTTAQAAAEVVAIKPKAKETNLILVIAQEVESMTKTKALNSAEKLAEDIETNYFKLGGVLKLIGDNSWFEGFESFGSYVYEKFGFQERKARYLMGIYTDLVSKQIPWEKVGHLGWTKLKDLAPLLTLENVDEWVAKAEKLTVIELQAAIKATMAPTGDTSSTTTDDVSTLKFKVKQDQKEVIQTALAKAKGELGTEFDNVALENICAGYVAGNIGGSPAADPKSVIQAAGWQQVLTMVSELWPEIDINLKIPEGYNK
jgi:hypothetical protein